jgi:hypothetical protein
MSLSPNRLVRTYLWLLGAGLLLEGAVLLALQALPTVLIRLAPGLVPIDTLHNAVHVLWGLTILGFLIGGLDDAQTAVLAIGFGLFYLSLAVLGTVVDDPFGLRLGLGENTFHYLVGTLALVLGILARRAVESGSAKVQRAAFPADAQAERPAAGSIQHDGPQKKAS